MTRIEKSIEINAPPEKIWPLIYWERLPEWDVEFKEVKVTSEEKNSVGTTVHLIGEVAGMKAEFDAETTELIENKKVAYRTIGGNMTGFGSITLTPTDGGTKVTQMIEYALPYSVLGKIIDKLRVSKAIDKSYDVAMKKLKEIAEK